MIIQMKKAKIVVLNEDKEALLKSLQKSGELMIISQHEENEVFDTSKEDDMLQKTERSLNILSKFKDKKSLDTIEVDELEYEEFLNIDNKHQNLIDDIEFKNNEITMLKSEKEALESQLESLLPWEGLDVKLSELTNTKLTSVRSGFVASRNVDSLMAKIESQGGLLKVIGTSKDQSAIILIYLNENESVIMDLVKANNFLEINLGHDDLFIIDKIESVKKSINNHQSMIEELHGQFVELSTKEEELKLLIDKIKANRDLKIVPSQQTLHTFYIEGWVRVDKVNVLMKAISSTTDIYDIELIDPEENEVPPTYTKNNKLVTPFESVTDMFSRPLPTEMDPNPTMSFWYWLLFGIMMGDAGYGVIMVIGGYLFLKLKKPTGGMEKLVKIITYCGFSTIIWGIVFGSYFSLENVKPFGLEPLIEPINEPINMLILSFVIGALHILTGLIVKTVSVMKEKRYLDALFDQISWIMMLVGAGLFFVLPIKSIGIAMAITGAVIILCTAGRSKPSVIGKATGGFGALYGAVNYFSDILSYSRLLALGLSTAIIAMVMNTIAGMLRGSIIAVFFAALIYIGGHAFNLVMGLLSAYVHDSRLQYVEYFGKFYEGGGYKFEPLSVQSKYIKK